MANADLTTTGLICIISPEKDSSALTDARNIEGRAAQLTTAPCAIIHYLEATPEHIAELAPSATIIGGQGTPWWEYTADELGPVSQALREATCPVLGICGGHQLIAQAFGGTVGPIRREGEPGPGYTGCYREQGWLSIDPTGDDPLLKGYVAGEALWLNHCEEVKRVPEGFLVTATGLGGSVMAMRHASRPIHGVQFHPETNWEEHLAGRRLMERFLQAYSPPE